MIDSPSLVILIDCWDSPNKKLPKNIVSFLDNTESIHTIVLASYNCNQYSNKHWFHNYLDIFSTKQTLRKIKDLTHVHKVFADLKSEYPEENTCPIILDYISSTAVQLSMRWLWELEYYLSVNPEIKNVYVLGQAWESCVKIRPLGYESLAELSGFDILTNTDCVLTMDGHFLDLKEDSNWSHVSESIWKYKP